MKTKILTDFQICIIVPLRFYFGTLNPYAFKLLVKILLAEIFDAVN